MKHEWRWVPRMLHEVLCWQTSTLLNTLSSILGIYVFPGSTSISLHNFPRLSDLPTLPYAITGSLEITWRKGLCKMQYVAPQDKKQATLGMSLCAVLILLMFMTSHFWFPSVKQPKWFTVNIITYSKFPHREIPPSSFFLVLPAFCMSTFLFITYNDN